MRTLFATIWDDGSGLYLMNGTSRMIPPGNPDERLQQLLAWAGDVATSDQPVALVVRSSDGTRMWHLENGTNGALVHSPTPPSWAVPALTGPDQPSTTVTPPPTGALPVTLVDDWSPLWVIGAHGGAGESTLASLIPNARPAGHQWPIPADRGETRAVVVARTHATGLAAAQTVLRQWACGAVEPIQLLGLVLVADAPGRLPHSLAADAKLISTAAPRAWRLDWYEPWRRTGIAHPIEPPVTRLVEDLTVLSTARKADLT